MRWLTDGGRRYRDIAFGTLAPRVLARRGI
jgi:hypothetical protein